jgi:hypothetical protein
MTTKADKAALVLAMEYARRDPDRAGQLDSMLAGTRVGNDWVCAPQSWEAVAAFAASCAQTKTLQLRPWEDPPCIVDEDDGGPAGKFLRRMLAAGVSRWHPDPRGALAALE